MNMSNGVRLLRGTVHNVQFFGQLLAYGLGAKVCKDDCSGEQAFRTIAYTIPIMGNPSNPKEVTLWLRLDRRNDEDSELRIEHGAEFIDWQLMTGSLCHCCFYNKSRSRYFCTEMLDPSGSKKSCTSYKFNEDKLKEYFGRVKKIP